jgi:stearoyl-CoA desaturase (delta-9 desaturase)
MKRFKFNDFSLSIMMLALWAGVCLGVSRVIGLQGCFGDFFESHAVWKILGIWIVMAHLTISAMSISFHRAHTHQAVQLHRGLDALMQIFLWVTTSMSKLDWVSVHVYHHTHSDTPKDPHSPAQKGLLHVFFFGALDYSKAKIDPEVLKIRARIAATPFESYIARHLFQGPILMAFLLLVLFGPLYGSLLTVLFFSISPIFAVGGVNALAHAIGYQNYDSKDESRNLGFLVFLNWIICGELDHNNHHKYPKSPTFAHRWFEFDIGWVYIRLFRVLGLAKITGKIPSYRKASVQGAPQTEVAFVS